MVDKYKPGFVVEFEHSTQTEEWIFQEKLCNESTLVFYGYDANLMPISNLSERPHDNFTADWYRKITDKALQFTKGFEGDVWLDDIKIKDIQS